MVVVVVVVVVGYRSQCWWPCDSPNQWVRTLQDIARNRQQYRSCYHSVTSK